MLLFHWERLFEQSISKISNSVILSKKLYLQINQLTYKTGKKFFHCGATGSDGSLKTFETENCNIQPKFLCY